ncbi:MAG: DUF547 domain-containing protein [Phycisphaerae bacterium]|nr:DUF547 domain-containing protein [Phycisphaerae bacterium]
MLPIRISLVPACRPTARDCRGFGLLFVISLSAACRSPVPSGESSAGVVREDRPSATATTHDADDPQISRFSPIDWSHYGLLLFRTVQGDKLDAAALWTSGDLIERMLNQLAEHGPTRDAAAFQDAPSRLAYLINAHNLLVLAEFRSQLAASSTTAMRVGRGRYAIDGRSETVLTLRDKAIRLAGADWRVGLALFSGRSDGPRLNRRPFTADMLDIQLDDVVRRAVSSPSVVLIDHGEVKRLLLCRELYVIRGTLLRDYERRYQTTGASVLNALLEWASPFDRATLNSAVGYVVSQMPENDAAPFLDSLPTK